MAEIINSLWIGRPLALIEQLSIASFLQNGCEYHLYCYEKIEGVPKGVVVRDASEILPASEIFYYQHGLGKGSVAAFANLFRYKLLFERGGWWMDTDMVCLRPMDFSEPVVFAGQRLPEGTQQVTNTVIKFPRGHPAAQQCYEMARQQKPEKLIWGQTGPFLIDRVVRENKLQQFIKPPDFFCPVNYWEWESLTSSKPLAQLVTGETRAVHLWHELWRRAGTELDSRGEIQPKHFFDKLRRSLAKSLKSSQADPTPVAELLRRYGLKK
jgi:Glycosyltransferase sugar-binding region containing DXD motif/Alpha 1,4-glycosyltransferase conserved region